MSIGTGLRPPGSEIIPLSRLIIAAGAVKDQSVARLGRPGAVRIQEQIAMATQNALSTHPATLVQDQFLWARPHFQPATSTARTVKPRVRSGRGVAQ